MKPHPEEITYRCFSCDRDQRDHGARCRGKVGDSCQERCCANCEEEAICGSCGKAACLEHLTPHREHGAICDVCITDAAPRVPEPDGLDDSRPIDGLAGTFGGFGDVGP